MHKKFNKLLQDNDVTAYQVAKATGISKATIYAFKNGNYVPKADKIKLICDYFGVSLDHFYED